MFMLGMWVRVEVLVLGAVGFGIALTVECIAYVCMSA